jgi:hypothetical protein
MGATHPAPMVMDADMLLRPEAMRNGPLVVYWGQDEWIEPNGPLPAITEVPRKGLLQRLLRCKPWTIEIRIAPPPDEDLETWGQAIAKKLAVPWGGRPKETDRAIWLLASTWARHAGGALGSAAKVFNALDGFKVGAAQIRVARMDVASPATTETACS